MRSLFNSTLLVCIGFISTGCTFYSNFEFGNAPDSIGGGELSSAQSKEQVTALSSAVKRISDSPRSITLNKQSAEIMTRTVINAGLSKTDAHCIPFGDNYRDFGAVSKDDWATWMPDLRFVIGQKNLSVVPNDFGSAGVIRQKFTPSANGTQRVVAASNIPSGDTYRISQTVMFEPGWQWGGSKFAGGKFGFGFGGGTAPSGTIVDPAGFTARLMWRGNYIGNGFYDGTGRLGIYSYAADRPDKHGKDHLFDGYSVPIGEWIEVVYEVRMNTSINARDGGLRAWVNGVLVLEENQIGWQMAGGTPLIDTLYYSSFYGGSGPGWSPSTETHAKVRNVCIARVVDGHSGIEVLSDATYSDTSLTAAMSIDVGKGDIETYPVGDLFSQVLDMTEEAISRVENAVESGHSGNDNKVRYKVALTELSKSRDALQLVSSTSLSLNPVVGASRALRVLSEIPEAYLASGSRYSADLNETRVLIKEAILRAPTLALAVATNAQKSKGCSDVMSETWACGMSASLLVEAKSAHVIATIEIENVEYANWAAEHSWNTSVAALNALSLLDR